MCTLLTRPQSVSAPYRCCPLLSHLSISAARHVQPCPGPATFRPQKCLFPLGNYTLSVYVVNWIHPTKHPKHYLDRFSRFCTAYGRQSLCYAMRRHFFPQNCPFACRICPHLIMVFGPTRVNIPNGIMIGSAAFAGLMVVTDRPTDS